MLALLEVQEVLHHLTHDDKLAAFREARRVLAPSGSFHLADFGPPVGWYASLVARLASRGERVHEHLVGRFRQLMREAGFARVEERGHHNTVFGTLALYSAWPRA